jgi:hypothetical protein
VCQKLSVTQRAEALQGDFDRLQKSGDVASYNFDEDFELRNFNGKHLLSIDGQAKRMKLALQESESTLTLTGNDHCFRIDKNGKGLEVDGLYLGNDEIPRKYKDGRYFVSTELLEPFYVVLDSKQGTLDGRIERIDLKCLFPENISKEEEVATTKALHALVKSDNRLFKAGSGSSPVESNALVVYLTCLRDDVHATEYGCWSRLGTQPEVRPDPIGQYIRNTEENLLQIYFAQFLHQAAPQATVLPMTTMETTPFPANNPALFVTLWLASDKLESEAIFTQVARSLADAIAKFNEEAAKQK